MSEEQLVDPAVVKRCEQLLAEFIDGNMSSTISPESVAKLIVFARLVFADVLRPAPVKPAPMIWAIDPSVAAQERIEQEAVERKADREQLIKDYLATEPENQSPEEADKRLFAFIDRNHDRLCSCAADPTGAIPSFSKACWAHGTRARMVVPLSHPVWQRGKKPSSVIDVG